MREKINDWRMKNIPADNLIYKDGLKDQCLFVINTMNDLFLNIETDLDTVHDFDKKREIINNFTPYVIGTHMSKSVLLPVMEINLSKLGVKIILRYNFYDWCISIESEKEINCDFMGLITDTKGYYEGFPSDRIYEKYSETNNKKFSLCLSDKYDVYVFMFLLRNFLTK